jgi:hypothetical protein
MFDHIRAADRVVLLLNTVLLMVDAFLPFATSVLAGAMRDGSRSRGRAHRRHPEARLLTIVHRHPGRLPADMSLKPVGSHVFAIQLLPRRCARRSALDRDR